MLQTTKSMIHFFLSRGVTLSLGCLENVLKLKCMIVWPFWTILISNNKFWPPGSKGQSFLAILSDFEIFLTPAVTLPPRRSKVNLWPFWAILKGKKIVTNLPPGVTLSPPPGSKVRGQKVFTLKCINSLVCATNINKTFKKCFFNCEKRRKTKKVY